MNFGIRITSVNKSISKYIYDSNKRRGEVITRTYQHSNSVQHMLLNVNSYANYDSLFDSQEAFVSYFLPDPHKVKSIPYEVRHSLCCWLYCAQISLQTVLSLFWFQLYKLSLFVLSKVGYGKVSLNFYQFEN